MSLIRWNAACDLPTFPSDVMNMQREINRMFDNFFRGGLMGSDTLASADWIPAVDIAEREDEYSVRVELPGVTKDDVKITMQNNILTVRGEKKQEKESKDANFHRLERSYGSFERSFTLPSTVKADKIDASYADGNLTITLPKTEEARPKQIEVKVK